MTPVSLDAAILVAVFFGAGVWLCLSRQFLRLLFGVILLSNGANLVLLAISGAPEGKRTPIVGSGDAAAVDPLPQALILTAIVIGFAVSSYFAVLLYRIHTDHGKTTLPAVATAEKGKEAPDEA